MTSQELGRQMKGLNISAATMPDTRRGVKEQLMHNAKRSTRGSDSPAADSNSQSRAQGSAETNTSASRD